MLRKKEQKNELSSMPFREVRMIMPRGQPLLMPASPLFIALSFLLALVLHLLPWGPQAWRPDLLLLLLGFWSVHQPQRVGIGVAFVLGLVTDIHQSALLGLHSLLYVLYVFAVQAVSRRLLWLSVPMQALHLLPLFAAVHGLEILLRLAFGGTFPGWSSLWPPLLELLLWPLADRVLLAPQRRPPVNDENRPL